MRDISCFFIPKNFFKSKKIALVFSVIRRNTSTAGNQIYHPLEK